MTRHHALSGTWRLARIAARADRVRLALWVVGPGLAMVAVARGVREMLPDAMSLAVYGAHMSADPAHRVFHGPGHALSTYGGATIFEGGGFVLPVVALLAVLTVARATRGQEDSGLAELVRAGAVARRAPLAAALLVTWAAAVGSGVVVGLGLVATGLPAAGSAVYGLSVALAGIVFAVVGALAAQAASGARAAGALAGAAVGLSYLVRGMADLERAWWNVLSPLGLLQDMRPYAGERLWPAVVVLAVAVAGTVAAWAFEGRRDLGAGLLPQRPGRVRAEIGLVRLPTAGLTLRLERAPMLGWGAGLGALAFGLGVASSGLVDVTTQGAMVAAWSGTNPTEAFFAYAAALLAIVASCAGVACVLRGRRAEATGLLDLYLAGPLSRVRLVTLRLGVALGTATLTLATSALGLAAGRQVAGAVDGTSNPELVGRVGETLALTLVHAPAVWLVVALAALAWAVLPRWSGIGWAVPSYTLTVSLVGIVMRLPAWTMSLSPFDHVPSLPQQSAATWALPLMAAGALVVAVVAVRRLRTRDLVPA
ncbi:MAG: hypothetical protein FWD18_09450 [Micrococcales bacterium]|nr:hypothetical protein [Micrococcales bacterium]